MAEREMEKAEVDYNATTFLSLSLKDPRSRHGDVQKTKDHDDDYIRGEEERSFART